MPPNGSPPIGPFHPAMVLNFTNTTETVQLPNGTIRTFDVQPPFQKLLDKAHGDICKLPPNLRNDGVLCLPVDCQLYRPSFALIERQ